MLSKSHDETVIAMIKEDPEFAAAYINTALEELDEEGGQAAFLIALRRVVEAKGGMTNISAKTGLSRESLYRALSPKDNPTLRTVQKVINAVGLRFSAVI